MVESRDAYNAWLAKALTPPPTPSPGPVERAPGRAPARRPAQSVTLNLTAQGIAYDTDALEAPANTPFKIVFTNNDAGIPHNVAIHEDSPTGPEVWKGEIFNGVDDPDLRRAGPPGRDLRLRLHGPPEHDRHAHGEVGEPRWRPPRSAPRRPTAPGSTSG